MKPESESPQILTPRPPWGTEKELDELFKKVRSMPFSRYLGIAMGQLAKPNCEGRRVNGAMFQTDKLKELDSVIVGTIMEKTDQLLKDVNTEVLESKKILQDLANEIRALSDVVGPALMDQIKSLRSHRMTVVSEIRESLTALREIRKFFLETDYDKEMERLERFVHVCKEIQKLKADGTFDAVCDSAIRLALKNE